MLLLNSTRKASPVAADEEEEGGLCFSGETMVQILGKGTVYMKHLNVGDQGNTGHTKDGQQVYQPIYSLGHLDTVSTVQYLQLHHDKPTNGNRYSEPPIDISTAHLIFWQVKTTQCPLILSRLDMY
jgi:hypothetical protein